MISATANKQLSPVQSLSSDATISSLDLNIESLCSLNFLSSWFFLSSKLLYSVSVLSDKDARPHVMPCNVTISSHLKC